MKSVMRILSEMLTEACDLIEKHAHGDVSKFREIAQKSIMSPATGEELARFLLCGLAHGAPLDVVAGCLKTAGIDVTTGELKARFAKMLEERGDLMARNATAREIMEAGARDYADQARKTKH